MTNVIFNSLLNISKDVNQIVINLVLIGDPKSGKSSLLECFLNKKIEEKNVESVLNIHQTKINFKEMNVDLNFFELSGYFERDKDLIIDYIKSANIILLCHSFEQNFNEENFGFWLDIINTKSESSKKYLYMIGCKYDLKVMSDYQKGSPITSLMFPNGNLASFGERIKTFVNNNNIREYFMVSALLNLNIQKMFHSVIKDYLYDKFNDTSKKGTSKDNQNCFIF